MAYIKICTYEKQEKDCVKCKRDNSIRKKACPCVHFKQTLLAKLFNKNKFELRIRNNTRGKRG